jgi:hypothetical protein
LTSKWWWRFKKEETKCARKTQISPYEANSKGGHASSSKFQGHEVKN